VETPPLSSETIHLLNFFSPVWNLASYGNSKPAN